MARSWGWWTEHKLDILERYLQVFATASKKAHERIYLDLFAGWPENVSRETNEPILGSVHRALSANPPFTRLCLFELPPKAQRLESALRRQYPNRRGIAVHAGDTNQTIDHALRGLAGAGLRWAPTFAFIDQYDHEVHWSTLQKIATFKDLRRVKTKAEMWILFGTSFYGRGLRLRQETLDRDYAAQLTRMFGSDEWRAIAEGRRRGILRPEQWREELVNLMRWRLCHVLGYKYALSLRVRNTNGHRLYDMIFATDHQVGKEVMAHLYGKSAAAQRALRQHALDARRTRKLSEQGHDPLFELSRQSYFVPVGDGHEQLLITEPPHEPFRLSG
jgi:three-Cys-motif partner protein